MEDQPPLHQDSWPSVARQRSLLLRLHSVNLRPRGYIRWPLSSQLKLLALWICAYDKALAPIVADHQVQIIHLQTTRDLAGDVDPFGISPADQYDQITSPLKRCLLKSNGAVEIVSSFETSLRSSQQVSDLSETHCWTLLSEIGVSFSKTNSIEAAISPSSPESSPSSSLSPPTGLRPLFLSIAEQLQTSGRVTLPTLETKKLFDLLSSEERAKLLLALEMIDNGLKIVCLPQWWLNQQPKRPSFYDLSETDDNLPDVDDPNIIALVGAHSILSFIKNQLDLPANDEYVLSFCLRDKAIFSGLQLVYQFEEMSLSVSLQPETQLNILELLRSQKANLFKRLYQRMILLEDPICHFDVEDRYINFFDGPSSLGPLRLSTRLLPLPLDQCLFSPQKEIDVFDLIELLLDEIDQIEGILRSEVQRAAFSLPDLCSSSWHYIDHFIQSLYRRAGQPRPEYLSSFVSFSTGVSHLNFFDDNQEELPMELEFFDLNHIFFTIRKEQVQRLLPNFLSLFSPSNDKDGENQQLKRGKMMGLSLSMENHADFSHFLPLSPVVSRMDLSQNSLARLPNSIVHFSQLRELNLSDNNMDSLPEETALLSLLEIFDLESNQLTFIPKEIFQLTNLKSLALDHNEIASFDCQISNLTNLNTLHLSNNLIAYIDKAIGSLLTLQRLTLSNNKIETLPDEINCLTNLEFLNLSYNQLKSLPEGIGCLVNLQSLSLFCNALSCIPSSIGFMTNLQFLSLDVNMIETIPPEIKELSALERLSIQKNQLTCLPPEIGGLSRLKSLSIGGNQIQSLTDELCLLTNLIELSAPENRISSLPTEFGRLSMLASIDLSENRLTTLPDQMGRLQNLFRLNLSFNCLSCLPCEISRLTLLRELNLKSNDIKSLPLSMRTLTNLRSLNLKENHALGKEFVDGNHELYNSMNRLSLELF